MDLYNTLAKWIGWPAIVALLLSGGAYGYWVLNKHITILKEKISGLEKENNNLKEYSPDLLLNRLANRHKLLSEELERLQTDREADQKDIKAKELELQNTKMELDYFGSRLAETQELLSNSNLVCPHCEAPLITKEYFSESVSYEETETDIEHEHIVYECGFELFDGRVVEDCSRIVRPEDYEEFPE